jgi:signal transduction histidine kinase
MSSVPLFLQFAFGTLGLEGRIQTWARRSVVLVWVVSLMSVSAIAVSFDAFQPVLRGYQWVMLSAAVGLALLVGQQALSGHQTARILVVALLLLVLGIALRALQNTGYLDSGVLGEYGAHLGSTLCMIAMAYAADFQLRSVERLKALQLDHDLETSRLAERELERRVLQRTESLHRALRDREEALNVQLRAQQEQRQFIATLSHELRTPLAIVDATVQNLILRPQQDSGVEPSLNKIQRAATRMALLLDDQLDEARFRAFGDGLKLRGIDLAELLEDVVNAGRQIGQQHMLSVSASVLPIRIQVDPDRLGQALRNLLDNAVKYTPPGTEVVLSARQLENGVEIDVADQGPGLREEELPFLFERWFRGRSAAGQPGTGLGLALVRDLMRQMGGSVTLSIGPGGIGCIARLWLPSQASESAQDQQSVSGALKL